MIWRLATLLAVSALLTACGSSAEPVTRAPGTLYLLPLGDSITQADKHHTSYRYPLWAALTKHTTTVDFVGTTRAHHKGQAPTTESVSGQAFDSDHEGHWGWRADEILKALPDWLAFYPVDVVLLHAGTNDSLQGQTLSSTLDELTRIIETLQQHNPNVAILIARPGQSNWTNAGNLPALAEGITTLATQLDNPSARVIAVSTDNALTVDKTYDGLHPDANGESALADVWLNTLIEHQLLGE